MMRKKQQVRQKKGNREGKQRRLMPTEKMSEGNAYKKYNAVSLVVRYGGL